MKSFFSILFITFLTISFCACKKDVKVIQPSLTSLLVGKWQQNLVIDSTYTNATSSIDIDTISRPYQVYYQFNSNGTGFGVNQSVVQEMFSYQILNSYLVFLNVSFPDMGTGVFDGRPASIIKLTANEMILREVYTTPALSTSQSISYTKMQ